MCKKPNKDISRNSNYHLSACLLYFCSASENYFKIKLISPLNEKIMAPESTFSRGTQHFSIHSIPSPNPLQSGVFSQDGELILIALASHVAK